MPVVSVIVKTFFAFCDSDKIVIATSRANVEEVSPSFASFYAFAEQAFVVPVVAKIFVVVRHSSNV